MASRKRHIDGLKGVACLLIMLGHFSGFYKYAQNCAAIDAPLLQLIPYSLLAEGFWLRLFYILSGYLVSRSGVLTAPDLVRKSITRFFRLALPILGAAFFILVLSAGFGMHNADIQSIVANQWVGMSYAGPLTLKGAITEPFRVLLRGESTFNPVWWVLRDMFFASLLVYAICCLRSMLSSRHSYSSIAADAACIALILFFIVIGRDIYFSVLIGAFYGTCEKAVGRVIGRHRWICWFLLFAPLAGYCDPNRIAEPRILCLTDLSFVCFLIAVEHLRVLNTVFSKLDKLGSISFGVYSLHWPVFCSIGLLLIIREIGAMPGSRIYLISVLVSVLITVCLSVLFHASVERWSSMFCKKLDRMLSGNRETVS